MSPILVRPVREQLEHDRVIRLLLVKLKKKHEVIANIGDDQSTSIKIGQLQIFPDLVLMTADRARKLLGTVEVETSESVNHLEARSQWAHLGRARAPFHLYVPAGSVDIARRLATENQVNVTEIWSFHTIGDQTHFRLVHRAPEDTRRSSDPRGIVTTVVKEPLIRPAPPAVVAPPPVMARPGKAVAVAAAAPVKASAAAGKTAVAVKPPVAAKAAPAAAAAKKPLAVVKAVKKPVAAVRKPSPAPSRSAVAARKAAPARAQKRK